MNNFYLTPVKMVCKKDCPDRAFDCHPKCEKYAKYRAKCDEQMRERKREADLNEALSNAIKRTHGRRRF